MLGINLSKCPFCGGPGQILDKSDYNFNTEPRTFFHVGCTTSDCIMYIADVDKGYESEEEAFDAWERRVPT